MGTEIKGAGQGEASRSIQLSSYAPAVLHWQSGRIAGWGAENNWYFQLRSSDLKVVNLGLESSIDDKYMNHCGLDNDFSSGACQSDIHSGLALFIEWDDSSGPKDLPPVLHGMRRYQRSWCLLYAWF